MGFAVGHKRLKPRSFEGFPVTMNWSGGSFAFSAKPEPTAMAGIIVGVQASVHHVWSDDPSSFL